MLPEDRAMLLRLPEDQASAKVLQEETNRSIRDLNSKVIEYAERHLEQVQSH